MCKTCRGPIDSFMKEIQSDNHQFKRWNTTSVNMVIITIIENEATQKQKQICRDLLKKFLEWYKKNKKDEYTPDHGFTAMYPMDFIKDFAHNTYDTKEACKIFNENRKDIHGTIDNETESKSTCSIL